jgi:hypothetical protein
MPQSFMPRTNDLLRPYLSPQSATASVQRSEFGVLSPLKSLSAGMPMVIAGLFLAAVAAPTCGWAQAPKATVTQAPAAAATPQGPVVLQGAVVDPDSAEIPGATVTLTPAGGKGKAYIVTSKDDGTYTFRGVPAGTYSLTATMNGFGAYVRQGVRIGDAVAPTINIKMSIQDQTIVVNVTANDNVVSVDPEKNAGSTILTEKDLESFSDDPDELSSELSALAGPAAGPNGGQIYIDGFTGGQLPPKSSIREIRINQNPFSAQYDRAGFGRVEIFTKPGTDKYHGNFQLNGLDKGFNTGSPFLANATEPGYHSILTFGSMSGPINKRMSFTANGSYRNIQNTSIVNPPAIYAASQTSGVPCNPGQSGCTVYSTLNGNGYTFAQLTPQTRFDIGPRLDLALSEKNTMTVRFQYEHNSQQNQEIGGTDLPSTGYNSTGSETTLQVSDTQIISSKVINETRFEFQRPTSSDTPFNTTPSIVVQGAFTSGGAGVQTASDVQPHYEAQNYTSIALAKNFIRLGGRLRSTSDTNTTTSGSNGTFVYSSIANYQANTLSDFTITNIVTPTVKVTSIDLGLYAEDDWKIKPNITFSYGLRYETQNYIGDHKDFAPRLALAYGVTKKTVVRAGFGIFYDRFLPQSQLAVQRNNGTNQQQYTLSANTGSIPQNCTPSTISSCLPTSGGTTSQGTSKLTIQTIASGLRAPYSMQFNVGADEQLFKNATLSVNYQHIRGVHQFASDVPNAATASTTQPLNYQYLSEGEFNQNQLILNTNIRSFHGVSLFGYYSLNFAKSDTSGIGGFATTPNNLKADYGRANFDVRNRLFLGGSITLPYLIQLSPFVVAQSGQPFSITAGTDVFGDNLQNYRAIVVPAGTTPGVANGYVKTLPGCGTFATPGTFNSFAEAPINSCTGPALFTANLRVVKTFGFGPASGPRPDRSQGQQGGPQGPPGGSRGGSGGRGGGPGGGGPGGGGGINSGKRYNLTIGAQAQNLFNIVDRSTPVGTLTSPSFGTSTQLAGNIYTTDSAVRRITLQLGFTF